MQLQTTSPQITDQELRTRCRHCLLLTACCILTFTSCNDSFQPLQENDQYFFSIYGTLDAAADTQWVRVGTVRQSVDEPPNPDGIRVTLEDLKSGENVVMNDSVFTSRNVLNYWTTMNIEHEHTYHITAERTNGKSSRVTVTTPKKIPLPYIVVSGPPAGANIYIDNTVGHIADVQSVWYVILNPETEHLRRMYRFPIRNTLRHTTAFFGSYSAFANWEEQLEQIESSIGSAEIEIVSRQFFVAAGGPEWDDNFSTFDDLTYFLDGTASNVENGLGYVVGISSSWFGQADCLAPDRSKHIPCPEAEPFW